MSPSLTGEQVSVLERVVVSPGAGIFRERSIRFAAGAFVETNEQLGVLEGPGTVMPVRSPFGGKFMGMLAEDGERLREGQPVAWLRLA